jgi:hypothetical protein
MLCAGGFVLMLAGFARPIGGAATAAMLGGGGLFWTGALLLAYVTLW